MIIESKTDLIRILGNGSAEKAAGAMNITRQALWGWSEYLTQRQRDEANGAAIRLGLLPNPAENGSQDAA